MKPAKPNLLSSVSKSSVLKAASSEINSAIDHIVDKENSFARDTLPERLAIGLQCLKAHQAFAAKDPGKRNASGRNQHSKEANSRRELASFKTWLEIAAPRLKEAVAYKYMKAAAGLMLDHDTAPKAILPAIAAWEKAHPAVPITLAALIAASTLLVDKKSPELEQSEFDFFKDCASRTRLEIEHILTLKDRLPEEFRRVLSAQFYTALFEITGTHWCPTDEAPDIASIDPSAITI